MYVYESAAGGDYHGFVFQDANHSKVDFCGPYNPSSRPAPLATADVAARITAGRFTDTLVYFCNYDDLPWFYQS